MVTSKKELLLFSSNVKPLKILEGRVSLFHSKLFYISKRINGVIYPPGE